MQALLSLVPRTKKDLVHLSTVLSVNSNPSHPCGEEDSVTTVFSAGYNNEHELRMLFPKFDLTKWDRSRFTEVIVSSIKIYGHALHRVQHVLIKIIYHNPSAIDGTSFDAIPAVFIDFERELPADIQATVSPQSVIEGSKWRITRLRTYASPHNLGKIITYDVSDYEA